jgi:hypothetical protein
VDLKYGKLNGRQEGLQSRKRGGTLTVPFSPSVNSLRTIRNRNAASGTLTIINLRDGPKSGKRGVTLLTFAIFFLQTIGFEDNSSSETFLLWT